MSTVLTRVDATLQQDGMTLKLDRPLATPPGRVTVTVQPSSAGQTMLEVLDRIHNDQRRRGRAAITDQEMAARIEADRRDDEAYEERCREIERQSGTETDPRVLRPLPCRSRVRSAAGRAAR